MAGTEVGSLYYDLNIDDKNLKGQLDSADQKVKGFGDRVGQYWNNSVDASKKFMLGVVAAGAAAVAFGVSTVRSFEESQNQIAQTNAVLKSTGGIAGVTADQVTKLSQALERTTKFSDEEVRSAENLLLTFTSIGKDIFPQATRTVLDMATALGEDTKSASIQLGKALQDPILGVTALRRVGVNFSKDQQEVIAKLVETGQKAKAQQLILKELNTEFGGSAEAAGNTFAGQLAKLGNQFDDLKENIGGFIVQSITPLLMGLNDWINRMGGVQGITEKFGEVLKKIQPYIPYIAGAIAGALVPAVIALTIAFGTFMLELLPWFALGAAVVFVFMHFHDQLVVLWDALKVVGDYVGTVFIAVFNGLKAAWDFLYPSLVALWNALVTQLLPAFKQAWDAVVRLWNAVQPGFTEALKVLGIIVGVLIVANIWIWIHVIEAAIRILSIIISVISNVINWIANLISWIGTAAVRTANAVSSMISWFGRLPGYVVGIVNAIASFFAGLPGRIAGAVGRIPGIIAGMVSQAVSVIWGFYGRFVDAGWGLITAFANGIWGAAGRAVSAVRGVLNWVRNLLPFSDAKEGPLSDLTLSGKRFSQTFAKGVVAGAGQIRNAVEESLQFPNYAINGSINNPSGGVGLIGGEAPGNAFVGAGAPQVNNGGNTTVNIGTVQDRSDADYILRRIDRNFQLERMGVATQ